MGLDNGFIIKDIEKDYTFLDEVYYRKDYALRTLVLNEVEKQKLQNSDDNEYDVYFYNIYNIINKLKRIYEDGKSRFEEYIGDIDLPWYMNEELDECYNTIENRYELKAKINEVYQKWAAKILISFTDLLYNYCTALTTISNKDAIHIIFYDSY